MENHTALEAMISYHYLVSYHSSYKDTKAFRDGIQAITQTFTEGVLLSHPSSLSLQSRHLILNRAFEENRDSPTPYIPYVQVESTYVGLLKFAEEVVSTQKLSEFASPITLGEKEDGQPTPILQDS